VTTFFACGLVLHNVEFSSIATEHGQADALEYFNRLLAWCALRGPIVPYTGKPVVVRAKRKGKR